MTLLVAGLFTLCWEGEADRSVPPDSTWEKWPQCWQQNSLKTFLLLLFLFFYFTLTTRWEPNEWSCFLPCWNSTSVWHWSKSKLNILSIYFVILCQWWLKVVWGLFHCIACLFTCVMSFLFQKDFFFLPSGANNYNIDKSMCSRC